MLLKPRMQAWRWRGEAFPLCTVGGFRVLGDGARRRSMMRCLQIQGVSKKVDSGEQCVEEAKRWQAITGAPKMPALVMKIIKDLKDESAQKLEYKGSLAKIQSEEDKRHRAVYRTIEDSEQKIQFFAARQIACRLLGATAYLCEHCWIPTQDCICGNVDRGSLWRGIKLWVYMHPKDFMRKNNTGKLLWHSFGSSAVRLCIYGMEDQEDSMWRVLEKVGHDCVWCLYPERSEADYQVNEIPIPENFADLANRHSTEDDECALHFILMDGTWNNSKAMLTRMNLRANQAWGLSEIPCLALIPPAPSAMHDLRPQPSIERTCTAAAAAQLLRELNLRREVSQVGLDKSAKVIDSAIRCLFDALASRRHRTGRPICRVPVK